jgi:ABC-2 type transport system permease protein
MIANQLALIRRELWEHRSIYITPAVVALVITMMLLTGYIFATGYKELVNIGIVGAQNLAADAHRRMALAAFLIVGNTVPFILARAVLIIFYSLDSLYAERKDKSILFWRSLPLTDTETVVSKLLTAVVVIPLISFGVIAISHLVSLALTSLFVSFENGSPGILIWKSAPLFDVWATVLIISLILPIWFSPFIGWFLLVSAWTKRSPLLTAFLPLVLLPMVEYFIPPHTHYLGEAIKSRFTGLPLFSGIDPHVFFDEKALAARTSVVKLVEYIDLGKFLSSPATWAGVLVCGIFVTAAIYVRRYRDES